MPKPKLAIIGSGLAGLSAAWLLKHQYQVTLFEQHDAAGMGIFTAKIDNAAQQVDIPLRVFTPAYYPNLWQLYRLLEVKLKAVDHAAAFYAPALNKLTQKDFLFSYKNMRIGDKPYKFLPYRQWLDGDSWRLAFEHQVFFYQAKGYLKSGREDLNLSDFVKQHKLDNSYLRKVLLPALATVCTCDYDQVLAYPADMILDFVCCGVMAHGVYRAEFGVADIVARLSEGIELVSAATVEQLERQQGLSLSYRRAGKLQRRRFDAVVFACQAQQAASILQSFPAQQALLQQVPVAKSQMLVHSDSQLAHAGSEVAAPVSYYSPPAAGRPQASVNLSAAGHVNTVHDVFQTWNPIQTPAEGSEIARADFTRPLVTLQSRAAMLELARLQQDGEGVYFAGSYIADKVPLLEAALDSALEVARLLGVEQPWPNAYGR